MNGPKIKEKYLNRVKAQDELKIYKGKSSE